ncbi:MAG: type I DNA topoisomerase [Spirochaetales bacterium]
MEKNVLVIVESPTKAKTIKKFLPSRFQVEASVGHIRDLPQTAAEIPANVKDQEWTRLGINVEDKFAPLYVIPKDKAALVRSLKALVKDASEIYLATDEDREGESISWHLLDVLSPKVPVKRMVFHEITERAIQEALEHTRQIDMNLVNAQETRRILDRLYGYTLSPLIWKKIAYGLSAGRVQSPGLRLIVERELARCRFKAAEYWDLKVQLKKNTGNAMFEAKLSEVKGRKVASGKDFDPETGLLSAKSQAVLLSSEEAAVLERSLKTALWVVSEVQEKETRQKPADPFTTSTLQQESNRKLGYSARDTMRVAQKLYEEGFITYMRTDSPSLSQEALAEARATVGQMFGTEYLPPTARQFAAKSGSAQEAHEAIRPSIPFRTPEATGLSGRERALYELIWKRTLASQMAEARKSIVNVKIEAGDAIFGASGVRIVFPGFLRVYVEGSDDPEAALDNMEVLLPPLAKGEGLTKTKLEAEKHLTKAPARFTEAALVQRLEKEGIGRPSTYATIIATLQDRGYVFRKEQALVPTFTGMAVTAILETNFPQLVDYEFTSRMEERLDEIALGQQDRLEYLTEFYSGPQGLSDVVKNTEKAIDANLSRSLRLPQLPLSHVIKIGRFGPYLIQVRPDGSEAKTSLPEDTAPADLKESDVEALLERQESGPMALGTDPESGKPIYALTGRYGPHLQVGDKPTEKGDKSGKPRTVSLPKGMEVEQVNLDFALKLLSLPRTLGKHPETSEPVTANNGRFGPYVAHNGEFRSLKKDDDLFAVTLERALELFAEEKKSRATANVIKEFLPGDGGLKRKVSVLAGRYGAYLKSGVTNISLPDDRKTPEAAALLTVEEVLILVQKPKRKA